MSGREGEHQSEESGNQLESQNVARIGEMEPIVTQHVRRVSEPPGDIRVEEPQGMARVQTIERNWSLSNLSEHDLLLGTGWRHMSVGTPGESRTLPDFSQLHASWVNTETVDLLGSDTSYRMSRPTLNPSFDFATLDRPDPLSSYSRVSTSPKVDSFGVSSVIHDAARIGDWDKVLALCQTQPEAAKYSGRDGWTALHHVCNRRCPKAEVADALITAYPEALVQPEEKGWFPLHYACRFKAPKEVVRLLLHMFPDKGRQGVSKRDKLGRTPLYYAIRYDAPTGVVGLLLQVDPSVVLEEDQNEESPLALVWDSWAEKLEGRRIVQSFLPGGFPEPEDNTVEQRALLLRERLQKNAKLLKIWNKVNVLLKAAFGFKVDEDEDLEEAEDASSSSNSRVWRIVHATSAVKCHLSLFRLACALHPEQVRELDDSDLRRPGDPVVEGVSSKQTALHLAASSNATGEVGKTVVITLLSLYPEAAQIQDDLTGSLPLHLMVENKRKHDWPNHAAILYHFYPRAVQCPDNNGRLPLHRACAAMTHVERNEAELEHSVIIQLVRPYPQAGSITDNFGCLPFHYVAMNAIVWDEDVDAVYRSNRNALQLRAGETYHNRLPIHMAAASPVAEKPLLQKLIHLHPRSASMADKKMKLPLHLACESGKEWEDGVDCIYEALPSAVKKPEGNERGWLPLHLAAASFSKFASTIEKLVEVYPDAALQVDADGRYPLHLACEAGRGWSNGLKTLFEANPTASSAADKSGLLPLHIVALKCCKPELDTDGDTLLKISSDANINETTDAKQIDILFDLLKADPAVLSI